MDGTTKFSKSMKHNLVLIFSFFCYWLGIDSLFYFLNRKAKRIITFHNVLPQGILPNKRIIGLTDSEETFRLKIREIKKQFPISVDIADYKSATITFDDGYLNQAEVAGRILQEEGDIPAIIFAAGRMIDNKDPHKSLIVDLLLHWTYLVPNGEYTLTLDQQSPFLLEITNDNRNLIWQKVIWPSFVGDTFSMGQHLLAALDKLYPIKDILLKCNKEYLRLRLTGISQSNIKDLSQKGWLIGWHTYNHYPLSCMTREDKMKEISELASQSMKNIVFSYPYGECFSVDEETIRIAEESGYPCAVSNTIAGGNFNEKYFLPRLMLSDNKYLIHFELSGLKYFLKRKKLFPNFNN